MSRVHFRAWQNGALGSQEQVLSLAMRLDPSIQRSMDTVSGPADAKARAASMEKTIKNAAVKTAVLQTGLQMGLMMIPAVGQAISLVAGFALGGVTKSYMKKLKKYTEKKTAELEAYVAKRQKEYDEAISKAYQKAYKEAAQLALSWQELQFTESERDEIINKPYIEGLGIIDKLTGRDMYKKGQREVDALVKQSKKDIDAQLLPIIAKVKQPGFVAMLTKTIASEMRSNPEFLAIARQFGAPPPSRFLGTTPTPSAGSVSITGPGAQSIPSFTDAVAEAEEVTETSNKVKIGLGLIGLGVAAFLITR